MKHTLPILSRNIFKIVVTLTFVTLMTTVIQAQDPPVVEPEQESKWKKAGQEIKEAAGAVGEASKDSFDKAREESSELWDKAREESEEAWDKTKEGSKKIWDKTKETTAEGYDVAKEKVHEMTTPEPVDVPKEPLTPPAPVE